MLRPWSDGDVSAVVAAYQEPEIQRWHARSMTAEEAGSAWSEEKGASWAVVLDGALAGRMTLKFHLGDACAGAGFGMVMR